MNPRATRLAIPEGVRPYVQVAIAATAWGTWSLFFRPAHVDPTWTSPIVLAVITVVCAPLLIRRSARGPEGGGERRLGEWGWILLLGVVDAGNALCFFAAMSKTTIAIAVLSHYLAPLLVALFAPAALGTPKDPRARPLAAVALVGLALVLEPWKLQDDNAVGRPLLGALLGAASAVCYAANVIVTKKMGTRFTAEEQLVWHSVVSAALLFATAIVFRVPPPDAHGFELVALAGTLVGASAGLLFLYGLRRIPAEHAGMLCFLEPLTAVVVAWLAWGERPGTIAMLGGVLVVASGALTLSGSRTPALP